MDAARASRLMEAEGVDAVVASTLENVFYLSGVWHLGAELFPHDAQGYVVATREQPDRGSLVLSMGEADLALDARPGIERVYPYGSFFRTLPAAGSGFELDAAEQRIKELTLDRPPSSNALEAIAAALTDAGLAEGSVAVDERGPDRGLLDALRERFPRMDVSPAAQLFRRIRMVKTPDELDRMRETLRVTESAFRATVDEIRTGVTERQLVHVFERSIVEAGGRPGFTLIRYGRGMATGQAAPTDLPLRPGDAVWFDVGCTVAGYRSDIGRIVAFGEASEHLQHVQAASRAGQDRAIELMTPGTMAKTVFEGAVERVREAGIPDYQRHHVGHGIGIEYYDLPILTPSTEIPLEPNMIFEVETPYYELGFGGAFIEDTVLVTEHGARILTSLDRDLMVLAA